MRIKLVDSKFNLLVETVAPDFHRMPSVILWEIGGDRRAFVRWDSGEDEWVEAPSWTVRGSSLELSERIEMQVSRR